MVGLSVPVRHKARQSGSFMITVFFQPPRLREYRDLGTPRRTDEADEADGGAGTQRTSVTS
jgi:hypothetical protein